MLAGGLWLLAALGVDLPVGVVTPLVLIGLGVVVLVSAVRGQDGAALGVAIFVGVWLAIGAVVSGAADVPLTGAVGDRAVAPTTAAALDDGYRLFAGTQTLDLRDLELPPGTTDVTVSTVLGEVDVRLPEGMAVRIDAAVAAGAIDLDGTLVDGLGPDRQLTTGDWADATRRLDLELRVGLGQIRVQTD
jgi:hypothetical protein